MVLSTGRRTRSSRMASGEQLVCTGSSQVAEMPADIILPAERRLDVDIVHAVCAGTSIEGLQDGSQKPAQRPSPRKSSVQAVHAPAAENRRVHRRSLTVMVLDVTPPRTMIQQAGVEFRLAVTELRILFNSMQDSRRDPVPTAARVAISVGGCRTASSLCILQLVSRRSVKVASWPLACRDKGNRELTFQDLEGRELWKLPAEGQVTLDPELPFKAMIHLSHLGHHPGGEANPLPAAGGDFRLVVDEGLFIDRPEIVEGNRSVLIPAAATCGDYNFSCGEGRQLIDNATWYRCADPDACSELDNETCCEAMPSTTTSLTTTEAPCVLNDTNCSNETVELSRRLMGPMSPPMDVTVLEATFDIQVLASPVFVLPIKVCETRYQDLHNRTARIYVNLQVPVNVRGRRVPQEFEVHIPPTAVQDGFSLLRIDHYM
eukprot:s3606_g13.t1